MISPVGNPWQENGQHGIDSDDLTHPVSIRGREGGKTGKAGQGMRIRSDFD